MPTIICNSETDVLNMLTFITQEDTLAYDIETDSLNTHTGCVIGFGVSNSETGYYLPLRSYSRATNALSVLSLGDAHAKTILQELCKKKLVMHNGSFDIRFTKNALGVDLLPALYADTMLMKHTCDENYPFGLKEIATMLWGHDVKKEKEEMQASIKANGGTATQYYKAETELIGRYCAQDCLLTYRLFDFYRAELQKQRLQDFYFTDEVMPLYRLVTIPMEEAGVRLDIDLMQRIEREITVDLAELEHQIQAAIAPHLGIFTAWFLNKEYPKKTALGNESKWFKEGLTQEQAWNRDNPGKYMFNLQSKPHLKRLFFEELKKTPLTRTPTGQPQIDENFIAAQPEDWCKLLTIYNKLSKIKSTYIIGVLDEVHNGRAYFGFKQHGTVSGRYSSDMQQFPRPLEEGQEHPLVVKYTNVIRSFLLPDLGCKLISADYVTLEPLIFSHVSGDPKLQNIFQSGLDFYSEIAIQTEGLRDVSSLKTAPNFLGKVNKAARQKAKSYALGICYGMTGFKLKFEIGCSDKEADALVDAYLNRFPELHKWMVASKEQIKQSGTIATQLGRIRHLDNAPILYKRYGPAIDNDLELWKQYNNKPIYEQARADRRLYKNYLNNGINFQIQGLGASIINRASIAIARRFKVLGLQTVQVGQVHDELIFNSPDSEVEQAKAVIKETMETIVKLSVPLKAEPIAGNNFRECK